MKSVKTSPTTPMGTTYSTTTPSDFQVENPQEFERPVPHISPSHDQLMAALYWIHDMMERALVPFFLVFETAEAVLQKQLLSGEEVQVGVRDTDWHTGSKRILDSFATPISETETKAIYVYNEIPIVVNIFPTDECIASCDTRIYEAEYFRLPNPYKKFMELYKRPWK